MKWRIEPFALRVALAIYAAGILGLLGCQFFGPNLIEAIYHGRSLPMLNQLISGQSSHALQEYQGQLDSRLQLLFLAWNGIFAPILLSIAIHAKRREWWPFALSFFLISAAIIARNPAAIAYPPLSAEDGPYFFQYFYENNHLASVFRYYAGYITLGPNLIGLLASQFGTTTTPYLLSFFPILISAATFSLITLPALQVAGLSIQTRIFIAIFLALAPIGNHAISSATAYSLWNLLLMLCLITVFWSPRSIASAVFSLPPIVILIWSHPLSAALAPLYIYRATKAKSRLLRVYFLLLAVVIASYLFIGIEHGNDISRKPILDVLPDWLAALTERVVFEKAFTSGIRMFFVENNFHGTLQAAGAFLLVIIFWYGLRKYRQGALGGESVSMLVYLILSVSFWSVYSRGPYLEDAWAQRYSYVPGMLLLFLLLYGLLANRDISGQETTWRELILRRRMAIVALISWLIAGNMISWNYYQTSAWEGGRIRAFVVQVARLEASGNTPWCLGHNTKNAWGFFIRKGDIAASECIDHSDIPDHH